MKRASALCEDARRRPAAPFKGAIIFVEFRVLTDSLQSYMFISAELYKMLSATAPANSQIV